MDQRTGSPESADSQEGAREEAAGAPGAATNSSTPHDRPESSPVLPPHWAPQPVHPPFAPGPPHHLDRSIFQERDVPAFAPFLVDHQHPQPLPTRVTRAPNHRSPAAFAPGVGAALAVDGGMEHANAVPASNRPMPKKGHPARQAQDGSRSSDSPAHHPSGVKKSKNPSSSSSRQATLRAENLAASLERFYISAGDLAAALASLQAILADVSADVAHEAANRAVERERESSTEDDDDEG
ncbi:hypothetical protein DSL72_006712 [Monilinia vaccinii-corymbosi]|uniref:Uncharacterized protein n=1 Tax=Monilinia vaccinii-corymbosi TaxID=61207 RepID=A0A8A3PPJ0_9HELO|nr:hypothetical protein DSL72_006712 [Monilinia vaccinii-corymbosi]